MAGFPNNFPLGLDFAPRNVLPVVNNSLAVQLGAYRRACIRRLNHWRSALLILLSFCLPAALFAAVTPATLTSPAAGSVLGSSATFSWSAGSGVPAYALWVGTTGVNTKDVFDSGVVTVTSVNVPSLPLNVATIYVALYSEINGVWTPINYTFTTSKTVAPATISKPAAGSVLSGSSATFSWTPIAGVTAYELWLGTTGQGSSGVYNSHSISATSVTVTGIPTKGVPLYATLFTRINGVYTPVYSTYTEAGGSTAAAALSSISCSSTSMTGSGSDACSVTLTAAAPSGGLSVKLSSSNAAVTVPATVTVPAAATSATFTATVATVSTAQAVTLTATAGSVSKTFALQLNAASVLLGVNSTSVAFGDVAVNTASTQSLTLTATGTAPVTISAATLTGTGFTLPSSSLPITLNPGQSVSLSVQFEPATAGAATGKLTISNSSSGGAAVIALSGTGATYEVGLTWQAPATSADPVAGYNIYRSPAGSSTYELVNSSIQTQTAYTDNTVQTGETYDYIIESVDASGIQSAPSTMASVVIP